MSTARKISVRTLAAIQSATPQPHEVERAVLEVDEMMGELDQGTPLADDLTTAARGIAEQSKEGWRMLCDALDDAAKDSERAIRAVPAILGSTLG